jgi:hypothetical protein
MGPLLMMGSGESVLAEAAIPVDDESDWALVRALPAFIAALARHRNWARASDPPAV